MSATTLLALAGAAAAATSALLGPSAGRRVRLPARATAWPGSTPGSGAGGRRPDVLPAAASLRRPSTVAVVTVVVVAGMLALAASGAVTGPGLGHLALAAALAAGVVRMRRRSLERRRLERATVGAGGACELLVVELGSGVPPAVALPRVAQQHPELSAVATADAVGSDVPEALRLLAARQGVEAWSRVADAWQVSARSGAALGPVLARVAQAERDEAARRRLVRTELADVVATARLMAALPWLLVGVASTGGGTAADFLLTTWPGFVCAAVGAGLIVLGLVWIGRISDDGTGS